MARIRRWARDMSAPWAKGGVIGVEPWWWMIEPGGGDAMMPSKHEGAEAA